MANKPQEKVKVVELIHTCDACPSQWEGKTSDGKYMYVRYRWGHLTIGTGVSLKQATLWDNIFDAHVGEHLDGSMTYEDLVKFTQDKVDWLLVGSVRTSWGGEYPDEGSAQKESPSS